MRRAIGWVASALLCACEDAAHPASAATAEQAEALTCFECHTWHYDQSVNPAHGPVGFGHNCAGCHVTDHWAPASGFDHATVWPLTGAHIGPKCSQCHGNFTTKADRACVACHAGDYAAAGNPNHVAQSLPKTCEICHSTAAWKPATSIDHAFPIATGKHKLACAKCHEDPSNYKAFTCISAGCHLASKTNQKHTKVNGYTYTSAACLKCHPDGKE